MNLIKSSSAVIRVNCFKITDASGIISVPIITTDNVTVCPDRPIYIPDDRDRDGPWNVCDF
jgi:hypothetical protein